MKGGIVAVVIIIVLFILLAIFCYSINKKSLINMDNISISINKKVKKIMEDSGKMFILSNGEIFSIKNDKIKMIFNKRIVDDFIIDSNDKLYFLSENKIYDIENNIINTDGIFVYRLLGDKNLVILGEELNNKWIYGYRSDKWRKILLLHNDDKVCLVKDKIIVLTDKQKKIIEIDPLSNKKYIKHDINMSCEILDIYGKEDKLVCVCPKEIIVYDYNHKTNEKIYKNNKNIFFTGKNFYNMEIH